MSAEERLDELSLVADKALNRARTLVRSMPVTGRRDKGDRDPVTAVDLAVEHALRDQLAAAAPAVGFLGEESGTSRAGASRYWVLDPVDGTVNLAHGLPLCAVSLGLIDDGTARIAAVDLPFLGDRFTAVHGAGAHGPGGRLTCSATTSLHDAVVAIGDYAVGADAVQRNRRRLDITARLAAEVRRIRMLGAATIDLAWVAAGHLDAAVLTSNKPWECAVGALLVREAGGVVVDLTGAPHTLASTSTVATTPALVDQLVDLLNR